MNPSSIPVHLCLGPSGPRKDAVIRQLLDSVPENDQWVALLQRASTLQLPANISRRIRVLKVTKGCLCCGTENALESALIDVVSTFPPDRVVVEAPPLTDPGPWLERLRSEQFGGVRLSVMVTAVLDSPRSRRHSLSEMPYWSALLACADEVVAT